jgi:hypothetical protein
MHAGRLFCRRILTSSSANRLISTAPPPNPGTTNSSLKRGRIEGRKISTISRREISVAQSLSGELYEPGDRLTQAASSGKVLSVGERETGEKSITSIRFPMPKGDQVFKA